MIRIVALVLALMAPVAGWGEPYPQPLSTEVNDFAGLLDESAEVVLAGELLSLHGETGIEVSVVTLATRLDYDAAGSLEAFALRLFNGWGVGDATRNDGIMIVVLHEDHEMRVQLGAAYNQGYDVLAQEIISADFLPDFREDDYQAGILAGARAVIDRIARPMALGQEAPTAPSRSWLEVLMAPLVFLGIAGVFFSRALGRLFTRFKRCPKCGQHGLRRSDTTKVAPTNLVPGSGLRTTICRNCDYRDERSYPISRRGSPSSRGSFGGGRSSGGGASGRW